MLWIVCGKVGAHGEWKWKPRGKRRPPLPRSVDHHLRSVGMAGKTGRRLEEPVWATLSQKVE
jgi:hypothetical protein